MDNAVSHTQKSTPAKPNDNASSQSLRIHNNEPPLSSGKQGKETFILLKYELRYEMERFYKNT